MVRACFCNRSCLTDAHGVKPEMHTSEERLMTSKWMAVQAFIDLLNNQHGYA